MQINEYKEVAYGPHHRQKLDAYIIERSGTDARSPVLIFFHGGGYLAGDKSDLDGGYLRELLNAGISVVTSNYRFIRQDPFPAPMEDGKRAIQFVRSMADTWGIDPDRIATSGGSAGGHIALWNALNGDLSDPDSDDPIERIRSDVRAFVGFGTQASKDQRFYEGIYEGPHIQPNLALYYGVDSVDELYTPDNLKLMERGSAITYMSPQAPPAFMIYDYELDLSNPHIPKEADVSEVIHHPMHGYILQQRYDALGIPFVLRTKNNPVKPGEIVQFLLEHLK